MDAISCLLAPPPASFADAAAIARALHFSATTMSPDSSGSSSSSSSLSHHNHYSSPLLSALADLPSPYAAPPHALTGCDSVLVADTPRCRSSPTAAPTGRQNQHHRNHSLAPAGGARARMGKRRSRASKRAPTTYISTDPANFRLMVQHITGVQQQQADLMAGGGSDVAGVETMMLQATTALDAAALLAAAGNPQLLLPAADDASAIRQHQLQQQQPCFPTLDSWNVMYETNSAEML